MSSNYSKLCSLLIEDTFGKAMRETADTLIKLGPLPLKLVQAKCNLPPTNVKKCLKTLIQFNIVNYTIRPKNIEALFQINLQEVISVSRYPKFCYLVNKTLGKDAETIMNLLIRSGQISLSKILFILVSSSPNFKDDAPALRERYITDEVQKYADIFIKMAECKYIIRTKKLVEGPVPSFEEYISDAEYFSVPKLNSREIILDILKGTKEVNLVSNSDDDINWRINTEYLLSEMKDEILIESMRVRKNEEGSAVIFSVLLGTSTGRSSYLSITQPVTTEEIKQAIKRSKDSADTLKYFNEYMEVLVDDPLQLILRISQNSYVAHAKEAFFHLTHSLVERIVEKKHGMIAARIFRLIKRLKFVGEDKLMEAGMISSKIGRTLLYTLVAENFVILKEVRKTYTLASNLTGKTVVNVYCVNFYRLVQTLLEDMCKASLNSRTRLIYEKEKNKSLLEKESKIKRILFTMEKSGCSEEQLNEVREMITIPERNILDRTHNYIKKLTSAYLHADRGIFILQTYLYYKSLYQKEITNL